MNHSAAKPQKGSLAKLWLPVSYSVAVLTLLNSFYSTREPAASQNQDQNAAKTTNVSVTNVTNVSAVLGGRPSNAFTRPYGFYLNPILEHVHANPDQKTRITAILQSYKGRLEPLRSEYKQKNQDLLNKLAHGDKPETIMDEQTHLGRLYTDITLYYCQMSLEVRKVLNPEQIVLYEEFKRKQGWKSR